MENATARLLKDGDPPAIRTVPFGSATELCSARAVAMLPVSQKPLTVNGCDTAEALPALASSV